MKSFTSPYLREISERASREYEVSRAYRRRVQQPTGEVEVKIAYDMAERIELLVGPPGVAKILREIKQSHSPEYVPFRLIDRLYGESGRAEPSRLTQILRAALAAMTPPGTTAAPNEGIVGVKVKQNNDGTSYMAVYYAGPIRSAGGTEIAGSVVLADYLRKVAGLSPYKATEEEVMRFIEEIRTYKRKVGNFQFNVPDEVLEYVLYRLPIEITGIATDNIPVSSFRELRRVETPYLRGGALRVVNDGVVGRARKLLRLIEAAGLEGWDWLRTVSDMLKKYAPARRSSVIEEVVGGRPVLSMENAFGGFRLRYGRAPNTSMSALGIHPYTMKILRGYVAIGTQLKTDYPGKGGVAMAVSTIEPPIVMLSDTSVIRVDSEQKLAEAEEKLSKVLFNGDILVSFGDCVENNVRLQHPGYCEEYWIEEVVNLQGWMTRLSKKDVEEVEKISANPFTHTPPIEHACRISAKLGVPLHPRYMPFWDKSTGKEIEIIRRWLRTAIPTSHRGIGYFQLPVDSSAKMVLESMLIEHRIQGNKVQISKEWVKSLIFLFRPFKEFDVSGLSVAEAVEKLSGTPYRPRMGTVLTVRVGRPEKARQRRLKPPVHLLFPIGLAGGATRDLVKASKHENVSLELVSRVCTYCGERTWRGVCSRCGSPTVQVAECSQCGSEYMEPESKVCPRCGSNLKASQKWVVDLKEELRRAESVVEASVTTLKGVKRLTSWSKQPEDLVKGILRASQGLYVYKDGTVRFDSTNAPLTHFTPQQIGVEPERLRALGYTTDIKGEPLRTAEQLLELMPQDILIPSELAAHLYKTSKFIDRLLKSVGLQEYYRFSSPSDVVGALVAVLSPHTYGAVVCRVIGITNARVVYAHPLLHAAKRRDCDGDEDSVMLLLDVFMNFSRKYLPDRIGGTMDTPLLLSIVIDPREVDEQSHNIEIVTRYPLEFYRAAERGESAVHLVDKIPLLGDLARMGPDIRGVKCMPHTAVLHGYVDRSSYTKKSTMLERVTAQLELCNTLSAIDPRFVAERVMAHHVLPDILGNLRTYFSQSFRCRRCGARYRRMLLRGVCRVCGAELRQTVYRGAVEKYVELAMMLLEEYIENPYLKEGSINAVENIQSVFKQAPTKSPRQLSLKRYM
ncbi:MAG: DNA polymerase II large subunit [Nitrososphaerota archaeon]